MKVSAFVKSKNQNDKIRVSQMAIEFPTPVIHSQRKKPHRHCSLSRTVTPSLHRCRTGFQGVCILVVIDYILSLYKHLLRRNPSCRRLRLYFFFIISRILLAAFLRNGWAELHETLQDDASYSGKAKISFSPRKSQPLRGDNSSKF